MSLNWLSVRGPSAALAVLLLAPPGSALADDAPPPAGCTIGSVNIQPSAVNLPGISARGDVQFGCTGITEGFANQLADIMNRIVQNRLDPRMVLSKLAEVDRVPEEGVARGVDDMQRQRIIQSLAGKPSGQIAIVAHPVIADSAEYAKGMATTLLQVGWQIEGQQIRRAAPKLLDDVPGVAIVVRDRNAPPPQALLLRTALAAGNITAGLVSDPGLAPTATVLWVGRRPEFMAPDQPK